MNLKIEMISVCGTDGRITPLRFRMEDESGALQCVTIRQIVCEKPIQYAGVDALQFLCKATVEERERMFELRYTVKTHRWTLFRMIY